jgi:antirestriction protein ArdC
VQAFTKEPTAIFVAAKDAERIADYVLDIEPQHTAMKEHAEWVADYEAAPPR